MKITLLLLMACTALAQVTLPQTSVPPNRKKPSLSQGMVVGAFAPPYSFFKLDSTPKPVISKADIILAVMDSMGAIVDNFAQKMEGDIFLPSKMMDAQRAVITNDSVTSFIKDLHAQPDTEPTAVAGRFQERYDDLFTKYRNLESDLDLSLGEELVSLTNNEEISPDSVSLLQHVLRLLST